MKHSNKGSSFQACMFPWMHWPVHLAHESISSTESLKEPRIDRPRTSISIRSPLCLGIGSMRTRSRFDTARSWSLIYIANHLTSKILAMLLCIPQPNVTMTCSGTSVMCTVKQSHASQQKRLIFKNAVATFRKFIIAGRNGYSLASREICER